MAEEKADTLELSEVVEGLNALTGFLLMLVVRQNVVQLPKLVELLRHFEETSDPRSAKLIQKHRQNLERLYD